MPPTGELAPQQIEALTKWVTDGLAWPKDLAHIEFEIHPGPPQVNDETKQFWSFRPVVEPEVPAVSGFEGNPNWARNEIDHFVLQKLQAAGLTPESRGPPPNNSFVAPVMISPACHRR